MVAARTAGISAIPEVTLIRLCPPPRLTVAPIRRKPVGAAKMKPRTVDLMIADLEAQLCDAEQHAAAIRAGINAACDDAGRSSK